MEYGGKGARRARLGWESGRGKGRECWNYLFIISSSSGGTQPLHSYTHTQSMIIHSTSDFSFQQTNDYTPLSSTACSVNAISRWGLREALKQGPDTLYHWTENGNAQGWVMWEWESFPQVNTLAAQGYLHYSKCNDELNSFKYCPVVCSYEVIAMHLLFCRLGVSEHVYRHLGGAIRTE